MSATIRIDKAGRLVLPKPIRESMRLREGSLVRVELAGDHLELTHEAEEAKVEIRGRRRVVTGWEEFDAAEAVRAARKANASQIYTLIVSDFNAIRRPGDPEIAQP